MCTIVACSACHSSADKTDDAPLIRTVNAEPFSETQMREFTFITRPYRSSELSFRVGGPISNSDILVGNYYRKGEVIAEIDPRDFLIKKERSEALLEQTQSEYERIKILFEKNNISASIYDKAKADYRAAKAAYETARFDLDDTRLLAPSNGYISDVFIEKYQDVKPSQPILRFIDIDQLKVEVYVPQEIAVRSDLPTTVELYLGKDLSKGYTASIKEVSKSTSSNNLSYLLTALLPNADRKLLAGMSGTLHLTLPDSADSEWVVIPQQALSHRPTEGDMVWIYDAKTETVKSCKVAQKELLPKGKVRVRGINGGETIATSGLRFLSDGMKVKVANN